MPIKRPDIYEHNNPNNAIADSDFVRGGFRTAVSGVSDLYTLGTKSDQLKERATVVYVANDNKYYVLVDDTNISNSSGWQEFSGGGGSGVPSGSWMVGDGTVSSGVYNGETVNFIGVSGVTTFLEQHNLFIDAGWLPNKRKNTRNVSSDVTLNLSDDFIFVDCSSAVEITLPTAINAAGKQFFVKRKTGPSSLRIVPNGAETIDGQDFIYFNYNYQSFSLVSDGVSWFIF
jgi:hypothetical protein